MFCPKCGANNSDDATFCQSCGNSLKQAASSPSTLQPNSSTGKSPIVAAILNLFFGVGYLYLGYKKILGLQTIVFVILALIVYAVIGFFTIGLVELLIAVILAIDGYQKGQGQKGFISGEL